MLSDTDELNEPDVMSIASATAECRVGVTDIGAVRWGAGSCELACPQGSGTTVQGREVTLRVGHAKPSPLLLLHPAKHVVVHPRFWVEVGRPVASGVRDSQVAPVELVDALVGHFPVSQVDLLR